jgi:large subunit ribosomal protein L23
MNEHHDIIQTVRLTEKATLLGEKHNQYVFRVARKANKVQIKRAVEALFNKTVIRVNTANFLGKARRQKTAASGKTSDWKKAIVTLKEGDKIEFA